MSTIPVINEYILAASDLPGTKWVSSDDIVILGGSLGAGLGNRFSDIDLYVFTAAPVVELAIERNAEYEFRVSDGSVLRGSDLTEKVTVHNFSRDFGRAASTEFRSIRAVAELVHKTSQTSRATEMEIDVPLNLPSISDSRVLNALISGKYIRGIGRRDWLLGDFSVSQYRRHRFLGVFGGYPELKDIAGARDARDDAMENLLARDYMQKQICALSCLNNNLIASPKWALPYLKCSGLASTSVLSQVDKALQAIFDSSMADANRVVIQTTDELLAECAASLDIGVGDATYRSRCISSLLRIAQSKSASLDARNAATYRAWLLSDRKFTLNDVIDELCHSAAGQSLDFSKMDALR